MSKSSNKVPMGQKIAFGVGMLSNQMFPAALAIFMVVLVHDYAFSTWMWVILFFLPRVFDAFTDPLMGFISDNTRSIWGRRRQYVLLGAVMMGISFALLWLTSESIEAIKQDITCLRWYSGSNNNLPNNFCVFACIILFCLF